MKVIIYFLLLQVVIFSQAKKLREITYYEYYPVITEKIKTGMEIQIIKGYCVIFENKCSNFLYIPKDKIGGGLDINAIKKINIDLLNFKTTLFSNVLFDNDYPYFGNEKQMTLKNKNIKQKILNLRKILLDFDKLSEIKKNEILLAEDEWIELDELPKVFSTYIVIKLPELSLPYILSYNSVKTNNKSDFDDNLHYGLNKQIIELVNLLEIQ